MMMFLLGKVKDATSFADNMFTREVRLTELRTHRFRVVDQVLNPVINKVKKDKCTDVVFILMHNDKKKLTFMWEVKRGYRICG